MKMPMKKAKAGSTKPHIRMRKLASSPPSAFPQGAAAFPPMGAPMGADPSAPPGGPPDPTQAMAGPPSGAAPGSMGS